MKLDPSTQRFIILANIMVLLAFATISEAGEIDRPVTQGSIFAEIQVNPVNPDKQLAQSVSLEREDTGAQVLCLPATHGEISEGITDPIARADAGVLLRAYAYAGPDCTGDVSLPTVDAYRVTFGAPGRPVLVRVE